MPRYEYVEGTSNKFWEIELAGSKYSVKWGRIGGSVSMSTKDCGDAAKAQKAYDKLIAEKEGKGYQLVGGDPAAKPTKVKTPATPPSGPARDPALEKAIEANPDDPDPYLVYADWLQARGEVRGELIVLQHAGKTKEANALLRKYPDWFLGSFANHAPPTFELEWERGYIKSAHVGWEPFEYDLEDGDEEVDDWGDACKARLIEFLELPSARFLRDLTVGPIPGDDRMDLSPAAHAIDKVGLPCLRSLHLGDIGAWDISSTETEAPSSKAIKGLQSLWLTGGTVGLGRLDLPELRTLKVESGSLGAHTLKAIAGARLPALETLEIWFGDPRYGASGGVKEIASILAGKGLSKLVHLKLKNCPFADALVDALIPSKILRQVRTLDLSMGNLSDRGIDKMVASKDAFAHLDELDLDDNALTEVSKPKVKGLANKVNYGRQDSPERAVPRTKDTQYRRYVACGE